MSPRDLHIMASAVLSSVLSQSRIYYTEPSLSSSTEKGVNAESENDHET